MVDLNGISRFVLEEKYFFYAHALTEAKKDGIAPEDAVYTILTGDVIEEYPDRQRILVFAMLPDNVPLHAVCDNSQHNVVLFITIYIPDDKQWIGFRVRRKVKSK